MIGKMYQHNINSYNINIWKQIEVENQFFIINMCSTPKWDGSFDFYGRGAKIGVVRKIIPTPP